jgi:hypothetical protein
MIRHKAENEGLSQELATHVTHMPSAIKLIIQTSHIYVPCAGNAQGPVGSAVHLDEVAELSFPAPEPAWNQMGGGIRCQITGGRNSTTHSNPSTYKDHFDEAIWATDFET